MSRDRNRVRTRNRAALVGPRSSTQRWCHHCLVATTEERCWIDTCGRPTTNIHPFHRQGLLAYAQEDAAQSESAGGQGHEAA